MKFKIKIGEIETDQIFSNYSDDLKALNNRWFRNDTFPGIGEDGQDYHLHYVDSREIWVAVRIFERDEMAKEVYQGPPNEELKDMLLEGALDIFRESIGKAMDALDDIVKLSGKEDDWPEMDEIYNDLRKLESKFDKIWTIVEECDEDPKGVGH